MSDGTPPSDEETRTREEGSSTRTEGLSPAGMMGRFRVLNPIGEGGMGMVYAAYDPKLDRQVAVKVLRGATDGHAVQRLLREAQALAQLQHPNVVAVHDTGVDHGRVFIAMEFVKGETLKQWTRAHPPGDARRFEELMGLLMGAGRGLAAAHRAGLIHRDVKPHNILCGDDGRVRVVDFGVARSDTARDSEELATPSGVSVEERLTLTGAVLGTPAYMAPEQLGGKAVDARADIFAFCVTAWEAIFGERPFTARTVAGLKAAIDTGRIAAPAAGLGVPPWIQSTLRKGLAGKRSARYARVEELLERWELKLGPRLSNRRARLARIGIGVTGLVVASAIAAIVLGDSEACTFASKHLEGVWDDAVRREAADAVSQSGAAFAASTWSRLEPRLDGYAEDWVAARTDACEDTLVRQEQSEALMDSRVACLDARLRDFTAFTSVLRDADAQVVEKAMSIADGLRDVERCADADYVLARVKPPEDAAAASLVKRMRSRVAEAAAARASAKFDTAETILTVIEDQVGTAEHAPLTAAFALERGRLHRDRNQLDDAQAALTVAYSEARGASDSETAAAASRAMLKLVASGRRDLETAEHWARLARVEARLDGDAITLARLEFAVAQMHFHAGRFEEALAHYTLSGQVFDAQGGHEGERASVLAGQASCRTELNNYDGALDDLDRAIAILSSEFGEDHPRVAATYYIKAKTLFFSNEPDAAGVAFQRAADAAAKSYGPDHPDVARALNGLGLIAERTQGLEAGLEHYEKSVAIYERAGGDAPGFAQTLISYGGTLARVGRASEAVTALRRALRIMDRTTPADHPDRLPPLINLGLALRRLGDTRAARDSYVECYELGQRLQAAGRPTGNPMKAAAGAIVEMGFLEEGCRLVEQLRWGTGSDTGFYGAAYHLGLCRELQGKPVEAIALYLEMLTGDPIGGPSGSPISAPAVTGMSRIALAAGATEAAVHWAEQAIAILTEQEYGMPQQLGEARFALARALTADRGNRDRDRDRALAEATAALRDYETLGPSEAAKRAEMEALIAALRR